MNSFCDSDDCRSHVHVKKWLECVPVGITVGEEASPELPWCHPLFEEDEMRDTMALRTDSKHSQSTREASGLASGHDMDLTPRQTLRASTTTFDRSSQASDTSSRPSQRSQSPIKRKADLAFCIPSIHFTGGADVQEVDLSLLDQMQQMGWDYLPHQLKSEFEAHPLAKRRLNKFTWSNEELCIEANTLWRKMRDIERNSQLCLDEEKFEDSWSDMVVYKILELAMEMRLDDGAVTLQTLKSTRIDPPQLAPVGMPGGPSIDKKVDYGLALDPDADLLRDIKRVWNQRQLLPAGKSSSAITASISQATTPSLRHRPLFCNVEMKHGSSPTDPLTQLSVWTSAGFSRWQELGEPSLVPPVFCWTIKGHVWKLHVMRSESKDDREMSSSDHTYETNNIIHIYQILATLCSIQDWAASTFRQRFQQLIGRPKEMTLTLEVPIQ